jgi:small subunit ribosomal protein S1
MAKKEQEEVQDVALVESKEKATGKKAKKVSEKVEKETKEEPVEKPKRELSLKERDPDTFLKEFNWENYQEGIDPIEDGTLKEFEKLVEENFVDTLDDEVVVGEVVFMTDRDAIIDINAKSEGVISLNEFRYNPDLKVGDKVEVLIDVREDSTGQLVLSHRKARTIKAWERVNLAHTDGTIVTGFIKCRTKGGMIVDVFGIEAFLPGSQIDVKPIRDYDVYVGKNMEFKVVKINHEFKNVVVSHKALIEADIEEQKKEIIGQLEKGQVLEGVVKNITSYGVFVDLGGVDGLSE